MKKLFPLLVVLSVLVLACNNKKSDEDTTNKDQQEQTQNNKDNNDKPTKNAKMEFGTPKEPVDAAKFMSGDPECDQIMTEYAENLNNYVYLIEQLGEGKDVPNEYFDAISEKQEIVGNKMKSKGFEGDNGKCWGNFSQLSLQWSASAAKAASLLLDKAMKDLQKVQ